MRDEAWVDLAKYSDPYRPYFYNDCFPPKKGSKGGNFKTKTYTLNVIIPQPQWLEYEAFKEELESNEAHKSAALHMRSPSPGPSNRHRSLSPRRFHTVSSTPGPSNHPQGSINQVSQGSPEPSRCPSPLPTSTTFNRLFLPERSDPPLRPPLHNDVGKVRINIYTQYTMLIMIQAVPINIMSSKRIRQHSASVSSVTTKSPPTKRPAPPLGVSSPNQKDIKEALKSGGAASLNVEPSKLFSWTVIVN